MCLTEKIDEIAGLEVVSGSHKSSPGVRGLMVETEWKARKCFSYSDLTLIAVAEECSDQDTGTKDAAFGHIVAIAHDFHPTCFSGRSLKRSKSEHSLNDAAAPCAGRSANSQQQDACPSLASEPETSRPTCCSTSSMGIASEGDDQDACFCGSELDRHVSCSSNPGSVNDAGTDCESRSDAEAACSFSPEFSESYDVLGSPARKADSLHTADDMLSTDDEDSCKGDDCQLKRRNSYHLTRGQAAVELFLRLNHARQTTDFVLRQAQEYGELKKAELGVFEALKLLNDLRDYESALYSFEGTDPDMPLMEHAFQTAELCRLTYPDKDWLHLVGLIHGLGKLLAHNRFGSQPQWAVCGETFPVGCRFAPQISGSQFFSVNPDRRRRAYNSPLGIYRAGCGLKNVCLSWSACEYLYLVLMLNGTDLPEEALFLIRYQKFYSLTKPGCAYQSLLSSEDRAMLPLLTSFQSMAAYRRVELPPTALCGDALYQYYSSILKKYIRHDRLFW